MSGISLLCCTWNLGDEFARFYKRLRRIEIYFQEIIICDDGSSDLTQQNLDLSFSKSKKYTLKFFKENSGRPSRSRNYGLDHVKSEYIMLLDWDDFVSFDYLEYVKNNISRLKIITGTKFATIDVNQSTDLVRTTEVNSIQITHFMQRYCNFITLSGSTMSTKILGNTRFQNVPLEDWLFWNTLLRNNPYLKIEKVMLPIPYNVMPSLSPRKLTQLKRVYKVSGKLGLLFYFVMKLYLLTLEKKLKFMVAPQNKRNNI